MGWWQDPWELMGMSQPRCPELYGLPSPGRSCAAPERFGEAPQLPGPLQNEPVYVLEGESLMN